MPFRRVIVHQPDHAEPFDPHAMDLADDRFRGVACPHDQHTPEALGSDRAEFFPVEADAQAGRADQEHRGQEVQQEHAVGPGSHEARERPAQCVGNRSEEHHEAEHHQQEPPAGEQDVGDVADTRVLPPSPKQPHLSEDGELQAHKDGQPQEELLAEPVDVRSGALKPDEVGQQEGGREQKGVEEDGDREVISKQNRLEPGQHPGRLGPFRLVLIGFHALG